MKKDRSNVRKAAHTSKSEQIKRYDENENVLNEVDRCLKRQLTWQHKQQKEFKALQISTRMWANAQPDGRPAEHRWRPLFNATKFSWRPLLDAVQ